MKPKLGSIPIRARQESLEGVRPHGAVVGRVHHGAPAGRGHTDSNDRQLPPGASHAALPGTVDAPFR